MVTSPDIKPSLIVFGRVFIGTAVVSCNSHKFSPFPGYERSPNVNVFLRFASGNNQVHPVAGRQDTGRGLALDPRRSFTPAPGYSLRQKCFHKEHTGYFGKGLFLGCLAFLRMEGNKKLPFCNLYLLHFFFSGDSKECVIY